MDELQKQYPWTKAPQISSAPMRTVAYAPLAVAVSQAGKEEGPQLHNHSDKHKADWASSEQATMSHSSRDG